MEDKNNEKVNLQDKRREVTHDESVLNPQQVHESDLSRKERRLLEKEKIKGMGLKRKLEYFWMYYKSVLFGAVGLALLGMFAVDWYQNAMMETVLSISMVNAGQMDVDTLKAEAMETLGYEDEYSQVTISSNLSTEQSGKNFDYYAQMAYMAQIQSAGIDVLVFPETLYEKANIDDIFIDMKEILDEETYEALGDQVKGDYVALTDSRLNADMGIYYEPVCAAVLINAEHVENAGKWITSIANAQ